MDNSLFRKWLAFMDNDNNTVLKIRFRLPNGEEFEAEGPREFIERERHNFLTLIGQGQISSHADTIPQIRGGSLHQTPPQHTELYLWEKLFKEDGETLILRQRTKLPIQDLALLLIAGAKALLNRPSYSALELAKSLKACGIEQGGRLDRSLAPEIQSGRLIAQGAKRSRTYKLSDSGFAKTYMLAEKLLKI